MEPSHASTSEIALTRELLIHGPQSRTALTSRLGLSPSSLTRLTQSLLSRGVLVELADESTGAVGRPSRPLDIAPRPDEFVGVKLTGDQLYAVTTGIRADRRSTYDHPLPDPSPDAVAGEIVRAVRALDVPDLAGLGVSLGGFVRDGIVHHAPFLGWRQVDLAADLRTRLGVPVSLENDVVALAEAERWFGTGRHLAGFVVVTIGVGVGYALVIDGAAVRTPDSGAATGGHVPLLPGGPQCAEGHRGCSQAMLTSGAIAGRVSAGVGREVSYEEALELARGGEPAARAEVDRAGDALGHFLALAANLTLQHDVVLGGDGVGLYALVEDRVAAAIRAGRATHAEPVRIHVDPAGFEAWARGAAAVAIQDAVENLSRN